MAGRRRSSNLLVDIAELPWWVGMALAALVFLGLRYGLPAVLAGSDSVVLSRLTTVPHELAPIAAGLLFAAAVVSAWRSWWRLRNRRRLLDSRTDLASVRALPWERFEHLVGEAYRRAGYEVQENASKGADGGVDLVLAREDETVLVQCKRWDKPVEVPTVRELLGAVTARGAARGIVVAAGRFTRPAETFARANGVELVDGRALECLIGSVRIAPAQPAGDTVGRDRSSLPEHKALAAAVRTVDVIASCPRCHAPMTRRTARRGPSAGSVFLGCTRFPACRGTRPVD